MDTVSVMNNHSEVKSHYCVSFLDIFFLHLETGNFLFLICSLATIMFLCKTLYSTVTILHLYPYFRQLLDSSLMDAYSLIE